MFRLDQDSKQACTQSDRETSGFLSCLLLLGHGASSWARGILHKASIWPLPPVILAAFAGEKGEEPQPRPAAPWVSLSTAHSWNIDTPPGKSTNSPFAYPRETCTTSCCILWLHSLFPLRLQKQAELLAICNQKTAAALSVPPLHSDLGCTSSFPALHAFGPAAHINKAETWKV